MNRTTNNNHATKLRHNFEDEAAAQQVGPAPSANGYAGIGRDELLRRLGGVGKQKCPGHDDREPSLSVKIGSDGRILLHCHAGCDTERIVKAVGGTMADLFPPKARSTGKAEALWDGDDGRLAKPEAEAFSTYKEARIACNIQMLFKQGKYAAEWTYHDHGGLRPVARVVRYDLPTPKGEKQKKSFRPISRHDDGWRTADPPGKWPLYCLAGLKDAKRVYVCEGEKKADALTELRLTATASAHGAKSAHKTDWSPLAGKEVVILPDNDDSGRKYADEVAAILQQLDPPATFKVLDLGFKGRREKDDVIEWLDHWRKKGKSDRQLRKRIERLADAAPMFAGGDKAPAKAKEIAGRVGYKPPSARPKIIISTDERRVGDEAIKALNADESLYQRGRELVRIVRGQPPPEDGIKRPSTARIEPLPKSLLRERLADFGDWQKTAKGKEVKGHPPGWCVNAVFDRGEWEGIRYLEAVVEYPILKRDGTVLDTPGYDERTGLYFEPAGRPIPKVPDAPTKKDAIKAAKKLFRVVGDFPFAGEAHKASWLAALLTPAARFAFDGPAPMFLVDANTRGCGKGLLLNVIARILNDDDFAVATYTDNEEELAKHITSIAIQGDRCVQFDNVTGNLGNATLDRALTATVWEGRYLGFNETWRGPLLCIWYATGNNVTLGADISRRVCPIRLVTTLENPETRTDIKHKDLLTWVSENRTRLLAAVLTILRAYCVAGQPDMNLQGWGSFDSWSRLVRHAVVWLGLPDPASTRIEMQERSDPTPTAMKTLLRCWQKMDKNGKGLRGADVVDKLYPTREQEAASVGEKWHMDMKTAIETLTDCTDRNKLPRLLGEKLSQMADRMFGDRCIQRGNKKGSFLWVVRDIKESNG